MKKVFLSLLIVAFTFGINAQEKGKIRFGLSGGLSVPNQGVGIGGDLDFRYNIMDNINIGVQLGGDLLTKDLTYNANYYSFTTAVTGHTLLTGDYYFNKGKSLFAPFVGCGLGSYSTTNLGVYLPTSVSNVSTNDLTLFTTSKSIGGLIRGGFELGHFRLGLDYYLVPNSNTKVIDENAAVLKTISVSNSYLKLSLGFYFGGGHWKK